MLLSRVEKYCFDKSVGSSSTSYRSVLVGFQPCMWLNHELLNIFYMELALKSLYLCGLLLSVD